MQNDTIAGAWGWNVDAPEGLTAVPPGGEPAVAAFCGPVAVSCRWYEDDQRLFVSPELLSLSEIGQRFPVAVVVDRYTRPGPPPNAARSDGDRYSSAEAGFIDVTIERTTHWGGDTPGVTSKRAHSEIPWVTRQRARRRRAILVLSAAFLVFRPIGGVMPPVTPDAPATGGRVLVVRRFRVRRFRVRRFRVRGYEVRRFGRSSR